MRNKWRCQFLSVKYLARGINSERTEFLRPFRTFNLPYTIPTIAKIVDKSIIRILEIHIRAWRLSFQKRCGFAEQDLKCVISFDFRAEPKWRYVTSALSCPGCPVWHLLPSSKIKFKGFGRNRVKLVIFIMINMIFILLHFLISQLYRTAEYFNFFEIYKNLAQNTF